MTKKKDKNSIMLVGLNQKLFITKWLTSLHRKAYSVPDCAKAIGISESALYMIEKGSRVPGLEVYFAMCLWASLDPCEYIMGTNEMIKKSNDDYLRKYPTHKTSDI